MSGKYRKAFVFTFNYSIWMNTFCHTVCCICAVELTMLWDIWHSHNINNMIHATYSVSHKHAFKEGSSFRPISSKVTQSISALLTATAGLWIQLQTLELWGRCLEYWSSQLLTILLHSPAYFFSWVVKNQISSTLLFQKHCISCMLTVTLF